MDFYVKLVLAICLIIPCLGNTEQNGAGNEKTHHHHHHRHHYRKTSGGATASQLAAASSASALGSEEASPVEQQEAWEENRQAKPKAVDPRQKETAGEIRGVYFVVKLEERTPPTEEHAKSGGKLGEDDGGGGGGKRWRRNVDTSEEDISPVITAMTITANVANRFSTTKITSMVSNPEDDDSEVTFVVQIPEKAFISNFTMIIDGKFFVAEVRGKDEAEKEYSEAKKRNETAGKVSVGSNIKPARGMEIFSVSINVAASSKVEFVLTYQQLLERKLGVYTQVISVRPSQVIPEFKINVDIVESQGITFLNVTLNDTALNDQNYEMLGDATSRQIEYQPSVTSQKQMDPKKGLNTDLKIMYDVKHTERDAGMVCVDGEYFIHYFSPSGLDPLNKNVVFVIDISGSMAGEKIRQTMVAMWSILDVLRPQDKFQIILFNDRLIYWPVQQSLVTATPENIRAGKQFLGDELKAGGSTDINWALLEACKTLKTQGQWGSNIIVFLTDGQPTAGETNQQKIVNNVVEEAANKVSVFSLGFGNERELDFQLLKKISYRTGVAEGAVRIYQGIEADDQLRYFFKLVNTPLMYNVKISYPVDIIVEDSLTQNDFPQYFDGSELVVAGKLQENMINEKTHMAISVGGVTTMEVVFDKTVDLSMNCPKVSKGYVQKLYAYMMIKYLLIQEQKTDVEFIQKQIRQDALKLALDYNLVTPLTSFIIVQQESSPLQYNELADYDYVAFNAVMRSSSGAKAKTYCNTYHLTILILLLFFI